MKRTLYLLPAFLLLASCGGERVETYRVPKEQSAQSAPQPAAAPAPAAAPVSAAGFSADLPEGWTSVPPSSAMRKAAYSIDGTEIDAYFITLSMGDVLSNVNRWERQVGLEPSPLAEVEAGMNVFSINGHTCRYFEIYNQEGGRGIIAAIIDLPPSYWYFTAKGSAEELQAHSSDMQAFLRSMKFDGHNH